LDAALAARVEALVDVERDPFAEDAEPPASLPPGLRVPLHGGWQGAVGRRTIVSQGEDRLA
jgi:hypothetical protein